MQILWDIEGNDYVKVEKNNVQYNKIFGEFGKFTAICKVFSPIFTSFITYAIFFTSRVFHYTVLLVSVQVCILMYLKFAYSSTLLEVLFWTCNGISVLTLRCMVSCYLKTDVVSKLSKQVGMCKIVQ